MAHELEAIMNVFESDAKRSHLLVSFSGWQFLNDFYQTGHAGFWQRFFKILVHSKRSRLQWYFFLTVENVQTSVFPLLAFKFRRIAQILNRFEYLKKTTCILEHVMPRCVRESNFLCNMESIPYLLRPLQRFLVLHLEQVWSRYKRQRAGAKE